MSVEAGEGFDREEFARLAARSVLVRIEGAASAGT